MGTFEFGNSARNRVTINATTAEPGKKVIADSVKFEVACPLTTAVAAALGIEGNAAATTNNDSDKGFVTTEVIVVGGATWISDMLV